MNNQLHASLVSNKTPESCYIGVNSRETRLSATDSPWHNADKNAINNQRSARINFASVFTTTIHGSTDRVRSDYAVVVISTIELWNWYNVQFDCMELCRICWVTWIERSPATDYSKGTSSGFCGSQWNWLNPWSVGEWNRYLKGNTEIIEMFYLKDECFTWLDLRL